MRTIPLVVSVILFATPALAATIATTKSFTGPAFVHTAADDYPNTGYSPPNNLGGYKGLLTFAGFDTSLGQLTGISLQPSASSSAEFTDAVAYGSSLTLNYNLEAGVQSPYGAMTLTNPYTFVINGTVPFYSTSPYTTYDTGTQNDSVVGGRFTTTNPGTFAPFLVPNVYIPVYGSFVNQGGTGSFLTNVTSTFTYDLTVTYDYTPAISAVPEPATWATMILGFAGIGGMSRRRKSKPASIAA